MKKLFSLFLSMVMTLCFTVSAWAADTTQIPGTRIGYTDYKLSDLMGTDTLAAVRAASSSKEATVGPVEARLFKNATGTIVGTSSTFKFTNIPTGAKITNVQAWNPSKSNISQGKFTAIENVQVFCGGQASGFFKFWVTDNPSTANPCNTTVLNGLNADSTYYIQIQGRVLSNYTGSDGFTIRGTKVRVTYSY
ncbi:hypothetical protein [Lacrimispora algidixylanolytica]|uniref:Fibronectin type-III domain-containing protein n=1 Tax=Lacrimispora algidixylanolytica TaxID=94868 RepID=A0A419T6Z8_9FIRM|nr:hypothetical protein [Lacrimispora algidixylanolytica]RKD33330.1 hypothetical protein BET01_15015 [Lacrimispora algidixylanolytica]